MDNHALHILELTSRTFFIPITKLPEGVRDAVASAYLCMRAIDEIEDHPTMPATEKIRLLMTISNTFQTNFDPDNIFADYPNELPEVSQNIGKWAMLAPVPIAPRIWEATATMASRMANWVERNWEINSVADLDSYTFAVAGSVGLLLSDLWAWYDGTQTSRVNAVGFGRGLQTVNILRNRKDDMTRGVNFIPTGWNLSQMREYAEKNLALAGEYIKELPTGSIQSCCRIPYALATATLDALTDNKEKLDRQNVLALVQQILEDNSNL